VEAFVDIASRRSGGIEVMLMWNRLDETLAVVAFDAKTNEELTIPVLGDEAVEVYQHPFAYAHRSSSICDKRTSRAGVRAALVS
jgi:hypothetical protein